MDSPPPPLPAKTRRSAHSHSHSHTHAHAPVIVSATRHAKAHVVKIRVNPVEPVPGNCVVSQSGPGTVRINISSEFEDMRGSSPYYFYTSGQSSPSDTLDSGTCSDLDGSTPPPLPKKTGVTVTVTRIDHQRGGSLTSSGADVESDDEISCDSLNSSELDGSSEGKQEDTVIEPVIKQEQIIQQEKVNLPSSVLKDIRGRTSRISISSEEDNKCLGQKVSTDSKHSGRKSVVEERAYEDRNNKEPDLSDFNPDSFYDFHLNEKDFEPPVPKKVIQDDDDYFAGCKGYQEGDPASATIRSSKGTIRGVKNRVRAGIATFLQMHATKMFPAVYALMSRKTEDGYRRIFTELVTNVCPNSKETVVQVMCDYELGMMNAAKDVWQGAKITGCYFHFAQAVYRKHQTRQLKTLTNKNPGAWRILQMSMSLPLLPAHLIEAGVQAIERFARNCGLQVMDTFIKYLRSHWLQTVGADRVSVHGFDQRTNNALEGFYSRLKRLMGPHTGVWNFLDHLRAVDKSHLLDYCRLEQGQQIKQPRRNKWLLKETNLTAAWADLEVAVTHLPPIDAAERFLYSVIHTVNRRPVPRISKGNTTARLPATVTAPNRSPLEANQPTCTEVGPSGASMFHLIQVNNDIVPVQYHIQPEAAGVVVVPLQPPEPLFTVVGYGTPIQTWQEREAGKVVVYTTTMGIVRDTYQRCLKVRQILRTHLVKFDEKDVFMSRETQAEIKERMSTDQIVVPQLFIEGQYIGDAEVVERLNETGELRRILKPYKSPDACTTCQVCGGYRLLPCAMCNGSKKSVHRNHFTTELVALKCMNCDEVGLVKCYAC